MDENNIPVLNANDIRLGPNYYNVDELYVKFVDLDEDGNVEKVTTIKLHSRFTKKAVRHRFYVYKMRRVVDMYGIPVLPTCWFIKKTFEKQ